MAPSQSSIVPPSLRDLSQRNIIFVTGKGGVGKTLFASSLAHALAENHNVLHVLLEDPGLENGAFDQIKPGLWRLNADPMDAFEEYVKLMIKVPGLARLFVRNKLIQYLARAAPGIHELVLLGKVWHEAEDYDHVIVDLPSTGYGLAMFHSTRNFSELFRGGPVHRDADAMFETFGDPEQTGHLILALPEEMPLRESLVLNDSLREFFPENPACLLVNQRFPLVEPGSLESEGSPSPNRDTPIAQSATDYCLSRSRRESQNLKIWEEAHIPIESLSYVPPQENDSMREELKAEIQALIQA